MGRQLLAVWGPLLALGATACATLLSLDEFSVGEADTTTDTSTGGGTTSTGTGGGSAGAGGEGGGGALPGQPVWSTRFGGDGDDSAAGVGVAPDGAIAIAGAFAGTIDFGCGELTSHEPDQTDVYTAVLEPGGSCRWSWDYGEAGVQAARAVATDSSGNVAVAGVFWSDMPIQTSGANETLTVSDLGVQDIFVALFDAPGELEWALGFGQGQHDQAAQGVTFNSAHDVIVTGNFLAPHDQIHLHFGSYGRISSNRSAFVLQRDAVAAHHWDEVIGGYGNDSGFDVAADGDQNVFVVGEFQNQLGWDGIIAAGAADVFVFKLEAVDGDPIWRRHYGDPGDDRALGVTADGLDAIVVGEFENDIAFEDESHTSNGGLDLFVVKLDTEGNLLWSRTFGGSFDDSAYDVAVTSTGDIVVVGTMGGPVDFGDQVLEASDADVFVLVLEPSGATRYSRRFGGEGRQVARGVAIDDDQLIVIHGEMAGTMQVGAEAHHSVADSVDVFVAKLVL